MSYKVTAITNFKKEAKKLIKKYPSLIKELDENEEIQKLLAEISRDWGKNQVN